MSVGHPGKPAGSAGMEGEGGSMRSVEDLIEAVHREASRADFPIDTPVYEKATKDPNGPSSSPGRWRRRFASSPATWARTRSRKGNRSSEPAGSWCGRV